MNDYLTIYISYWKYGINQWINWLTGNNAQHLSHILDATYIPTIQGSPNSISETPSISMLHLLTVVVTIKSIPLHLCDCTRFRTSL